MEIERRRVINTTPHAVESVIGEFKVGEPFVKARFESDAGFDIRLKTVAGVPKKPLGGTPVFGRPIYGLDTIGAGFENGEIDFNKVDLIVSTLVAAHANDLRERLKAPELRVLVPDSGPSAIRYTAEDEAAGLGKKGQISAVLSFFEY